MKSDSHNGNGYQMSLECTYLTQSRIPQYDPNELIDICHFLLSSGTSGTPKAIKMGFRNLIDACLMSSAPGSLNLSSDDVVLVVQPLPHIGGIHQLCSGRKQSIVFQTKHNICCISQSEKIYLKTALLDIK